MATLKFSNMNKIYPNNVQAVFDFNLDISDKEFIVFVGPSGCGKSTTLRMVAGLESITSGNLYIDGTLVNNVEPMDRGIAMVFQNYALYPHMTVFKNMAFSLNIRKFPVPVLDKDGNKIPVVDKVAIKRYQESIKDAKYSLRYNPSKKDEVDAYVKECEAKIEELKANPSAYKCVMKHMDKKEVKERVESAAKILGLTDYLERKPSALSGGQRQRVALGRAVVRNPKVFLMDEPLSNLDAKLRVQMRSELTRIHREVGATTIYVTHDQTEAMTMADRIVVMKAGYVQQIATPKEIYTKPANVFVATFIGSPSMNILDAEYDGKETVSLDNVKINVGPEFKAQHDSFYKNEIDIQESRIKDLTEEIKILSLDVKKNQKALDQRNSALKEANETLEFAKSALKGEPHPIYLGIRPENIHLVGESTKKKLSDPFSVKADYTELLGQEVIVYSKIGEQTLLFKLPPETEVERDESLSVSFDLGKISLFDKASTKRLN